MGRGKPMQSRGEVVGASAESLVAIDGLETLGESVVLSPDGETFVYVKRRIEEDDEGKFLWHELYLLRPGHPEEVIGDGHAPVWAPDGSKFACLKQTTHGQRDIEELYVYSLKNAACSLLGTTKAFSYGCAVSPPAWSPDGTRLALAGPAGLRLVTIDGDDGEIKGHARPLTRHREADDAVWSPDGRSILFIERHPAGDDPDPELVTAIDPETGGRTVRGRPDGRKRMPSWSSDGNLLAYGWQPRAIDGDDGDEGQIVVTTLDGDERVVFDGRAAHGPVFSPDGRHLAFWIPRDTFVVPVAGGTPVKIANGVYPRWRSNEELTVLTDDGLTRVTLTFYREVAPLTAPRTRKSPLAD